LRRVEALCYDIWRQTPDDASASVGHQVTHYMPALSYDEMDKLTPCHVCGSRRYWFDGKVWQCWNCAPPPSQGMIQADLDEVPD